MKTDQCNQIKAQIDRIKDQLDAMTLEKKEQNFRNAMAPGASKTDGFLHQDEEQESIIDEQELVKMREIKELKRAYREAFAELKELKNEAVFN